MLGQLALAALTAWMLARLGIRWEYVADAPAQIGDLLGRMFPPEWPHSRALVGPLLQTINIATLGTSLAIALSLPVAFFAALNTTLNRGTYALARLVMVVSRSVDTLIWALIFIIVVGPGSLAGVLAVAVRSIGFVAKLVAEGIEEIDPGQVEAVTATGANRRQVLLYAIVPQVRPGSRAWRSTAGTSTCANPPCSGSWARAASVSRSTRRSWAWSGVGSA